MIFDKLTNLVLYLKKEDYEKITDFLRNISSRMSDGLYIIEGNRIFAKVMSYKTKEYDLCNIEAHNKYIDIQSSILGAESIDVFDRSRLVTDKPYDDAEDFELFNSENALLLARNNNFPGYFSLLYPHDAHRPMQRILGFEQVKKFVIKVEIDK